MVRTAIPGAQDAGLARYQHENFGGAPELFSGDTPLPVSSLIARVAADSNFPGFSVVGYQGNDPANPIALANYVGGQIGDDGGAYASGALTFTNVGVDGETVTIDATVYTLVDGPVAAANEVLIGATAAETAQNLADAINADPDAIEAGTVGEGTEPHPTVSATVNGAVVTVRADESGTGGNAIATTETSTVASWGGATLSGGTDVGGGGIVPVGITTVEVVTGAGVETTVALFTAGCFNPNALNWDDSFNTDAKKEHAYRGSPTPTNILIQKPKYDTYDAV